MSSGNPSAQNRGRERRIYQLERSSTNRESSVQARTTSYASSASVTLETVAERRESNQRSRAGRASGAGCAWGSKPSILAYRAKKSCEFLTVSKKPNRALATPWGSILRTVQGAESEMRYQRMASAPC